MTIKRTDQEAVAFAMLKQYADRHKARICGDHVFGTDANGENPAGQVMYMPADGDLVTVMYGPEFGVTRMNAYHEIARRQGASLAAPIGYCAAILPSLISDFTAGLISYQVGEPFSESWPRAQCLGWNLIASMSHGFGGELLPEPVAPEPVIIDEPVERPVEVTAEPADKCADEGDQAAYSHYDELLERLKAHPSVKHVSVDKRQFGRAGDVNVQFYGGTGYSEDWNQKRAIGPRCAEDAIQNILDRLDTEANVAAAEAVADTFPDPEPGTYTAE